MADLLFLVGFFNNPALEPDQENHITVLPNFTVPDCELQNFHETLKTFLSPIPSFYIHPDRSAQLSGYSVTLVQQSSELVTLHSKLTQLVYAHNGTPNRFSGKQYTPHVTGWVNPSPAEVKELTFSHHRGGLMKDIQTLGVYKLRSSGEGRKV